MNRRFRARTADYLDFIKNMPGYKMWEENYEDENETCCMFAYRFFADSCASVHGFGTV
jgi:hypothetical protein